MFTVYILKSLRTVRYYIGHSAKVEDRLTQHNSGLVKSTKAYIPWEIIYKEEYETKSEAFRREMQIKSYKHGEAYKKLISNLHS
jgi:putative endonuclease